MKKRWFLCGTGVLFTADQILKSYTEQNLDKNEEKELAGPVVLRRVANTGMCLNLLSGSPKIVRAFSLAAAGFVSLLYTLALFRKKGAWKKAALSMMTAGAWSNTFDRFARGYVVDYIGFDIKDPKTAKITYNLGDFFITAGAVILSLCSLFSPSGKEKEKVQKREDADD